MPSQPFPHSTIIELARIGLLLFIFADSSNDQIGSSSPIDTFATRLSAQPLRRTAGRGTLVFRPVTGYIRRARVCIGFTPKALSDLDRKRHVAAQAVCDDCVLSLQEIKEATQHMTRAVGHHSG
jgi:hypothetical protein